MPEVPNCVEEEKKDESSGQPSSQADIDITKLTDDELEELVGEKITLIKQRQGQ